MRELTEALRRWTASGTAFAVATVVNVRGSAPRVPGAAMAVAETGEVVGSVSGGCVEGAVYEAARETLRTGQGVLDSYGISDSDAFSVGLTCGGTIDVMIVPGGDPVAAVLASIAADEPVALVTVLDGELVGRQVAVWPLSAADSDPSASHPGSSHPGSGRLGSGRLGSGQAGSAPAAPGTVDPGSADLRSDDRVSGTFGVAGLDVAAVDDARGLLAAGRSGVRRYGESGQRRPDAVGVFVQSFAPPPRMLVFGAIDYAAAVVRIGRFLGYRVTVCDARPVFATAARFPDADEVVCEWPSRFLERAVAQGQVDGRTVICVLTHDPKFDVPVLRAALRSAAAYVGAMGSRRTHDSRLRQLREAGLDDADLARLRSPIGLDIGSRTPEETAVSIAAEIIQARWGGSGQPLRATDGPIHHDRVHHDRVHRDRVDHDPA